MGGEKRRKTRSGSLDNPKFEIENSNFPFPKSPLRQALRALARRRARAGPVPLLLSPGTTYEALLDERVKDLEKAIVEIRNRLNTLFFAILTAVAADVVIRLLKI